MLFATPRIVWKNRMSFSLMFYWEKMYMNINDEFKEKIIANNRKITQLLQENEEILKSEGFKPPSLNYVVDYEERIHMPQGYIRTSARFFEKYHLASIVKKYTTRNNISYNLQLSDYYNLLLNRFYIWGSVQTMLYKQDIINLVSIIEALITEATENIFQCCNSCAKIGKCKMRLNKRGQGNMKESIPKLCEMTILNFDENEVERIVEIYDLRNRVHIRLAEENEFLDNSFCQDTHNELIGLLIRVTEQLNDNAVPRYGKCDEYKTKDT